jgi:hypothetical protein
MKFIPLLLATATSSVQAQKYVYPDLQSLLGNVTALSGLNGFVQNYQDVANEYAHLTNITVFAASNDALVDFEATPSKFNNPSVRGVLEAIFVC